MQVDMKHGLAAVAVGVQADRGPAPAQGIRGLDDEVEAAKARDRKAYELHGEYAYLNFPEDFADR